MDTLCDAVSGQCHCKCNVVGLKCDECAPGFTNLTDTHPDLGGQDVGCEGKKIIFKTSFINYRLVLSAISFPRNQVATPKLVNNMSSGIPGPSLGNLFPKLEYWGPFQPLAEKCENTIHISKIRLYV